MEARMLKMQGKTKQEVIKNLIREEIRYEDNMEKIEAVIDQIDRNAELRCVGLVDKLIELYEENEELMQMFGFISGFVCGCWYTEGGEKDECTVGESDSR